VPTYSTGAHVHNDKVVSPLTPRKYIVSNVNFVFDLHDFDLRDVFHEHNPGVK
jgi:hypothetical protein